jgi:hypothetical protein
MSRILTLPHPRPLAKQANAGRAVRSRVHSEQSRTRLLFQRRIATIGDLHRGHYLDGAMREALIDEGTWYLGTFSVNTAT